MKGIEIAKKLHISTSALRHYESWGIVPKVERQKNGYRRYTDIHEAYFKCIREMTPGFGMEFIKQIFPKVISGEVTSVLWEINQKQVELHSEKELVEHTIRILEPNVLESISKYKNKKYFSIGEVAKEAMVSTSAIRHWEKEGLLNPKRNTESNFRTFDVNDIRKIFIIRTVQRAVFSLDMVKEILEGIENKNLSHTREIALAALEQIDNRLLEQFKGIASFNNLLDKLKESES